MNDEKPSTWVLQNDLLNRLERLMYYIFGLKLNVVNCFQQNHYIPIKGTARSDPNCVKDLNIKSIFGACTSIYSEIN